MMPRPVDCSLRVCQQRAPIPGDEAFDREFARNLRNRGLHLVKEELHRAHEAKAAPRDVFSRIRQAVDVVMGRGNVWVERRGR